MGLLKRPALRKTPVIQENGGGWESTIPRILGVRFRVAFSHAFTLLFGQLDLVCGVAQQQQTADDRADSKNQNQPGIPRHRALLKGRPSGEGFRAMVMHIPPLSSSIVGLIRLDSAFSVFTARSALHRRGHRRAVVRSSGSTQNRSP